MREVAHDVEKAINNTDDDEHDNDDDDMPDVMKEKYDD